MQEKKELTTYYERPMKVKLPRWSRFVDKFLKNFSREEVAASLLLEGDSCLDIACGDGELLNRFLNKRYSKLVGVDISREKIDRARKMASPNTEFIVSDIDSYLDALIQRKTMFDDVYMLAILEHVFWPVDLLNKVSKILKKNGRVIVEVPNVAWLPHRLSLLAGRFPETAPTDGAIPGVHDEHIRFYSLSTLDLVFSRIGFRREKISSCGRLRLLKSLCPQLLAPDFLAVYKKR